MPGYVSKILHKSHFQHVDFLLPAQYWHTEVSTSSHDWTNHMEVPGVLISVQEAIGVGTAELVGTTRTPGPKYRWLGQFWLLSASTMYRCDFSTRDVMQQDKGSAIWELGSRGWKSRSLKTSLQILLTNTINRIVPTTAEFKLCPKPDSALNTQKRKLKTHLKRMFQTAREQTFQMTLLWMNPRYQQRWELAQDCSHGKHRTRLCLCPHEAVPPIRDENS